MKEGSFWEVVLTWVLTIYANLIFVVLWVGFAAALIVDRTWLDMIWYSVQSQPIGPRIVIWVLLLPIMVGLWIWESSWPTLGRWLGFFGIFAWTLVASSNLPKVFRKKPKRETGE
jgi:hypothetical protein